MHFASACSIAVFLGAVALSFPAVAETATVRAGAATGVATSLVYNPTTCMRVALPTGRVVRAPAHGTVEVRKFDATIRPGEPCAGKVFNGTALFYTSTRGYRGNDEFGYAFTWETYPDRPGTSSRRGTVSLTVQ